VAGRFLGIALALLLALPAAANASVAYVGDSLGVGTVPYLRSELDGVKIDDDSEIGRPSSAGLPILEQKMTANPDVVVFDLGTNDDTANPDALASDLAAARQIAGSRCMVIATLNRPPYNGVPVNGLNHAVTSFAAADGNVALVDWHARAQADPSLLISDGVHPTPQGYALRAKLFAAAIKSCGSGRPRGGSRAHHDKPDPDADRSNVIQLEQPKHHKPVTPVRGLATEVAKSVAVGVDFG
jgi:GDSL-like lipase/acylhydrolase family protein